MMLHEVARGHIRLENDKVVFGDGACCGFYDEHGNVVREVDADSVRFEEE